MIWINDNPLNRGYRAAVVVRSHANYGVRSIPTLLFIREGKVRETLIGLTTTDKLAALIDRNLPG